ncbi:MAG: diaminopimelate decarboxylase [Cytophagales bacterium]|nr:MAG: diaminopimelate decarboxylase [Cytophagales bacterium]
MQLENNTYHIQGIPVEQICKEFGTPLYVYDAQVIEKQILKLQEAFKGVRLKLKYACKALTNISILKLIRKANCDIDTVSLEEIEIALKAGFLPFQITFTPNSVPFSEIVLAVEKGVFVNIDNLQILEEFGAKYGNKARCSIRINPHVEAGGNEKIKTGHAESKFGISIEQQNEILEIYNKYNLDVMALHVHTGSDFSDVEVFMQVAEIMFELALKFKTIKIMDFGSGFKVAYKDGDKTTNITILGEKITAATKIFAQKYGSEPQIWFEPGKFIVSDAGILFAEVNVLKHSPASVFAGINTGLNHLIRPMMYDAYHEIVNVSNPEGEKSEFSVVGYICETDTFAWNRKLNQVRKGDILALLNAGAYGFSMSSQYNSRPRPAEIMIHHGKAHLIRKRETLEDILHNQIEIDV